MDTQTKPIKCLSLRKKEAEISIGQAINSAASANELPFFELEDIIFKYYVEIQRGAERERRNDEAAYKRQIAEYQNKKAEEEKEGAEDGGNLDRQSDA